MVHQRSEYYIHSEPRFRALLTEGRPEVLFHRDILTGSVRFWRIEYVRLHQHHQERPASTSPA